MDPKQDNVLMHYGTPRHSGRYPWGSGDNPYQHSGDFLSRVDELRKQGFTFTDKDGKTWSGDSAIAKSMGLTTTQFRTQLGLAKDERRSDDVAKVKRLREEGKTLKEIADEMGFQNDSSVRSLLNESSEARMNQARQTADFLKQQIAEKGMIDVGTGVERELGISREKLNQALYMLELEGYPVYGGGVPQVTNQGQQTNLKVLCPPGTEHKDIYNFGDIHSVKDYVSYDDGETFKPGFVYPESMDSSRLKIRYAEDGGLQRDGTVELRRGVADLDLGESHYAQVRILVDGKKYIKGMAFYGDDKDFPDGVDVIFNTNKKKGTPVGDVLKTIKDDPDNPFGSLIKEHGGQSYYIDKDGKQKLSLINKRAEEGDWGEWSDHLPSQFLSKQSMTLIKKQLGLAAADKVAEFDEICALTNPTVKKALLASFADDCDSAAVHLQAAALPRQKYQVILPITSMKDTEVYAPNYKDGETVALIRYPHGGTFEIPILKVNNKQSEAKRILGNALDAIGINSKVAERLSGADFDGDTVMVIPTGGKTKITSTHPLKGLEGFDPKLEYGGKPEGTFKQMKNTQTEMGKISNLITDMTLKGATEPELARAVRHSMVVIDAEKHHLDYKQSEKELDTLFKVLGNLIKEDSERFGKYHLLAMDLSTRILRSRRKTLELLAKQQINTGMLYDKVNSGVAAATDKLVESLRKAAEMMASTGDYHTAVKFYAEAIKIAKKRAGKVTRREVRMTVEMAAVMMRSKSESARARRLLNAILPHAIALEALELEQEILAMIETIDSNLVHDSAWKNFLDKVQRSARSAMRKIKKEESAGENEMEADGDTEKTDKK